MADYDFPNAMTAIDQLIAQQKELASQKPTGFLSNVDPVMLGLAQGLLSPTKTGGFGESVASGLAGASGPLAAVKKQQLDAQSKIQELELARAKLAMEAPYYQARAAHLAGLGSGSGNSVNQERLLINSELADLSGQDWDQAINSETGQGFNDEQEFNDYKNKLRVRRHNLSNKGSSGGAGGDGEGEAAGAIPQITNDAKGKKAYDKIPPGGAYLDPSGQLRYKGKIPGERG